MVFSQKQNRIVKDKPSQIKVRNVNTNEINSVMTILQSNDHFILEKARIKFLQETMA